MRNSNRLVLQDIDFCVKMQDLYDISCTEDSVISFLRSIKVSFLRSIKADMDFISDIFIG